ncbi:MAG TPA: glutamate--tRNA ligase [Candidatus Limiplasma sp.]|nr:glutamate--tRNA ligase [Candidatus Limiplasma sp.]HRX09021.1 glutamate--tRNA ligase [Candidatus Limiplasma sp.]
MTEIRTRFAPSPTGYMHLGGLRTALYAYLFAKQRGGKFILRIEDTDQEREVPGAVELIYEDMHKAGLDYDEGPDVGGPFGPYIQSQRKDMYMPYAMQLVESGAAYPCFCTKEELQQRRDAATAKGEQWKYDKHCLHIDKAEAKRRMESGEPYVIRQNIPEVGVASFEDLLYGHVETECAILDDNVLIKQDGLPTYNFANVIDDHTMQISHVIRGTEYLSSTPKYNLLYEAFGWQPPIYMHLPVVMKDATRKLSKRHGDPTFEDLLEQGYVRDAIINFIALLGWAPKDDREFFTLDDLVEVFDTDGLSKSPAIFNTDKLRWFNSEYIKKMDFEDYLRTVTPWFDKVLLGKGIDYRRLAELMHGRTEVFNQVPEMVQFLSELPDYAIDLYSHKKMKTDPALSLTVLKLALTRVAALQDFSEDSLKECLMELATENEWKTGQVMWPVRVALSGLPSTPGGATEIAYLLGKDETLQRLAIGINFLEQYQSLQQS